jgi:hypothetical protein
MADAGMPMPALVFWMSMPTYAEYGTITNICTLNSFTTFPWRITVWGFEKRCRMYGPFGWIWIRTSRTRSRSDLDHRHQKWSYINVLCKLMQDMSENSMFYEQILEKSNLETDKNVLKVRSGSGSEQKWIRCGLAHRHKLLYQCQVVLHFPHYYLSQCMQLKFFKFANRGTPLRGRLESSH